MKEQDLTLVGLTEDKTKLVLVSDSGEEFTLAADARLRAALRGDHAQLARLGQLETTMESALRPRDIQARIRAGASPEEVASAAQTDLDRVMGYATPVLAERAHMAGRAQSASVRRKAGEGPARPLGEAVAARLRALDVDPESVEWDSWRREDGRWTVVADFAAGGAPRHAEFVFDAPGRFVVADDDEARELVGEPVVGPARGRADAPDRRLSAVPADDELPLGEDAIDLVSDDPAAPVDRPDDEPTTDLAPAARAVRSLRPQRDEQPDPRPTTEPGTGDADWIATQASERPASPPREGDDAGQGKDAVDGKDGQDDAEGGAAAATAEQPPSEPDEPQQEGTDAGARKPRKNRRASVPSWDEIMFGSGKGEQ